MPTPRNLVHETSTSTGTGNFTLVAENGKQPFKNFGTGGTDVFDYYISNRDGPEWEVGTGHMSDDTTLVRDTVIQSTNANAPVNFPSGTKDVTNDVTAANILTVDEGLLGRLLPLDADGDTSIDAATDDVILFRTGSSPKFTIEGSRAYTALNIRLEAGGAFDATQQIRASGDITPSALTGDVHDYDPTDFSTASVVRQDSDDSANTITGLAGGVDGRIVIFRNINSTSNLIRFASENASSTAANRFAFDESAKHIHPNACIIFQYDAVKQRWTALGDSNTEPQTWAVSASDETGDLTTGSAKVTWHMPYRFTLIEIIGGLTAAGTTGSMIVDVNANGTTIMTTNKLQFLSGQDTDDGTAALTTTTLAKGDKMSVDIDSLHSTPGKGLKVYLVGFVD